MDNRNVIFTAGLLCGAAIGAALGLLYAPKSGEAMRRDLKRQADRLSHRAHKMYDRAADKVSDMAERGADALQHATDAAHRLAGTDRG